jgi:DNA polymerase III alpha subunit
VAGRTTRALDRFQPRRGAGERWGTYRARVRLRNELHYLSMHLTNHPMRLLRDEARQAGCITTAELGAQAGRLARVAGLVAATRRLVTRGGEVTQLVTLEDEDGLVECVLLPGVSADLEDPVSTPGPFLVGGRIEQDHGDVQLRVADVRPFYERPAPYSGRSWAVVGGRGGFFDHP